jgi:hypothetical protein
MRPQYEPFDPLKAKVDRILEDSDEVGRHIYIFHGNDILHNRKQRAEKSRADPLSRRRMLWSGLGLGILGTILADKISHESEDPFATDSAVQRYFQEQLETYEPRLTTHNDAAFTYRRNGEIMLPRSIGRQSIYLMGENPSFDPGPKIPVTQEYISESIMRIPPHSVLKPSQDPQVDLSDIFSKACWRMYGIMQGVVDDPDLRDRNLVPEIDFYTKVLSMAKKPAVAAGYRDVVFRTRTVMTGALIFDDAKRP